MKRIIAVTLVVLALACERSSAPTPAGPTQSGSTCSVQGNGNTLNCAPATPTQSPAALGGCVPQTAPYSCSSGNLIFGSILEAAQRGVAPAPEPIYVAALVKALNQDPSVCAQAGPTSDEVTIKARLSNAQSETWDVVRGDGAIQAIPAAPLPICNPARF